MKLQLDTKNKIIRLEDKVSLKDLVTTLERLLPKKEWQMFTLETNTVIQGWSTPIYIREYKPLTYPWYNSPYVSCETVSNYHLKSGTYNIEL